VKWGKAQCGCRSAIWESLYGSEARKVRLFGLALLCKASKNKRYNFVMCIKLY
jgi:hypothetical protein